MIECEIIAIVYLKTLMLDGNFRKKLIVFDWLYLIDSINIYKQHLK